MCKNPQKELQGEQMKEARKNAALVHRRQVSFACARQDKPRPHFGSTGKRKLCPGTQLESPREPSVKVDN